MPIRTCLVCRKEGEKKDLLRFVLKDGEVELDKQAIKPGRGAYLCNTKRCLEDKAGLMKLKGILGLGSRATKGERKKVFRRSSSITASAIDLVKKT